VGYAQWLLDASPEEIDLAQVRQFIERLESQR
jgi:hypothetical protein